MGSSGDIRPEAIPFGEQFDDDEGDIQPVSVDTSEKENANQIQERTLHKHFQRMSCERKVDLLTKMFYETKRLSSLSSILNVFFAVNTKMIFYSKITNDSNSLYEQMIQDHDRMLDNVVLDETLSEHMHWFRTLQDSEQIDVIISMLRLSGGNVIKRMYWRLVKIFNERSLKLQRDNEKYISRTSMNFTENIEKRYIPLEEYQPKYTGENEKDYNTDSSTHKKVVEGRKQWNAMMGRMRKDIETEAQKLIHPIPENDATEEPDSRNAKKKKKKNKKRSLKNSASRSKNDETDWIQLLPVWTVKKIFSYLDKKVLLSLKNVNNYWNIISKEVLAEQKMRLQLDSTIKKIKDNLEHLLGKAVTEPELSVEKSAIVRETTAHRRRMEKQRRTAASLKVLKIDPNTLHTKTLLPECFQLLETEFQSLLMHLRSFPVGVPIVQDEVGDFSEIAIDIAPDEIEPVDGDKSPEPSKIMTFDQDKEYTSDTIDILTVGSLVPSVLVSYEDMNTW